MVVEWFINGHPILAGSRVKMQYDFGFITFDIRGAIAEDSGIYTLKATNALGEATKECRVTVKRMFEFLLFLNASFLFS